MIFEKQRIVAHRGAKGLVKYENTIEAFQKAIDIGAEWIEIDLRKTKDNKIVVFHDPMIENIYIKEMTHNEMIEKLGYNIPTLEEVLKFASNKVLLDIELKESGYVEEALEIIRKYLKVEQFHIRSFNDDVIVDTKNYDSKIITSLLLGKDVKKKVIRTRLSELFPGRRIKKCGCDYVSAHYRLLKFGFVKRMHKKNIAVCTWTVNEEEIIRKLIKKVKVDSIVTDFPNLALKILTE